ncbi:hypothetical protein [Clostridium lundense]|uniref:hypothetical protein n=1 Tax=Clostridium lundense TaxID=319475 RepID=UPI000558C609|nr:hypothetical protein [Clostridium lundense]
MIITNKEDINKYIKYYYEHIGEKNLLKALTNYFDSRGFGIEDIWCCFANEYEEWEEERAAIYEYLDKIKMNIGL